MSEDEFRATYRTVNPQRCCFEKTLLARRAACHLAHRLNIGEREGVACQSSAAQQRCENLLQQLRHNAIFALGIPRLDGPLPHAKEMKVQIGGLAGLQQLIPVCDTVADLPDIAALLERAAHVYPNLDNLPYATLARSIVKVELRRRSGRGK